MKLVIFDLETTGLDRQKDQIIQFSGIQIETDTHQILKELNLYIRPAGDFIISDGAYIKHHISKEFLMDKPFLSDVAPQIIDFFDGIDNVLTYNGVGFDIPFLKNDLSKYGYDIDFTKKNCYDAFLEEKRRNGIGLENTYKRYKGKTMEEAGLKAHDAMSDIKATYTVFIAQQKQKPYNPETLFGEDNVISLQEFNGEDVPCFNIGKNRGVPVKLVAEGDQNYIRWCVSDKCNFSNSTKEYLKKYLN